MRRWISLLMVCLAFAVARIAGAGDEPEFVKAIALQKVVQKVIGDAENSVACILVSRSEGYHDVDQGPDKNNPGKLGSFDPQALKANPRLTEELKQKYQKQLDLAHPGYVPQSFGSGVVIDGPAALVLTNYHVVQEATKLYVRLPGGKGSYADIVAADPRCDLAILKLLAPLPALKAIALGDADRAERGQFVLTLSNPYAAGFRDGQPSVSLGILSNSRRRSMTHLREEERVKPLHYHNTLLQTDARLHLGCSGGALLNLRGEMIGLLTSLAAIQGIDTPGGFAIPINAGMRRIIDVLKRGEEVDYGFLGIGFDERGPDGKTGVTLTLVGTGSPADKAGLKERDVLVSVNDRTLHDTDDVFSTIGTQLAGSKARLTFRRGLNDRAVDVTLAKLYVPGKKIVSSLGNRPWFRGLRVDYTSLLAQQPPRLYNVPPGVLVSDIQPNSLAELAKIKQGDIITQVNQHAVNTPEAFYQAVADKAGPLELTLYNFPPEPPSRIILK